MSSQKRSKGIRSNKLSALKDDDDDDDDDEEESRGAADLNWR